MNKKIEVINNTVEFIENHLENRLELGQIAGAVHYSKYHLHRLFSKTTGMTLHNYIQRRQLTRAAEMLIYSDASIIDITVRTGYETQPAFSSAFKSMYKFTPGQFRKQGQFYPLQFRYKFSDSLHDCHSALPCIRDVQYASTDDIPGWMELVRLVVDGFPHLNEEEYCGALETYIRQKRALIIKQENIVLGIMMLGCEKANIDFLGVHPLYRQKDIDRILVTRAAGEYPAKQPISISTYREGDKADTGYRKSLTALGFIEDRLLTEFGYPTQRFILNPCNY